MNAKKILLIAVLINLFFLISYVNVHSDSATEEQPQDSAAVQEVESGAKDQWEILRQRQEELAVREKELKDLELRVDEKIKELRALESSIQQEVDEYRQLSDERIRHLVKIYSSMKPKAAAQLMNNLDLNVAVEVFLSMKGDIAGGILSYMDTNKAATITKRLANYKTSQGTLSGQP